MDNFSIADELKKLKELLDAGAITQEEFEVHKAKLLNQNAAAPQPPVSPISSRPIYAPPPPKKKRGRGLKIAGIVFLSIILLSVLINIFVKPIPPATSAPAQSEAEHTTSKSSVKPTEEPNKELAKIGTTVSNKDAALTVLSVQDATELSDTTGYLSYKTDSGVKYIVVEIKIDNIGEDMISFSARDFQLYKGKTNYSPSILISVEDYFNSPSINPGLSETGIIAFEVPEDISASDCTLKISKLFSMDSAEFALK